MDEYVVGTSWKTYIQKLSFYFNANEIKEDAQKKNVFLTVCGDATFSIADSLVKPATLEATTFANLKAKLDNHFSPAPNHIVERFKFNKRDQNQGESIADYVAELRRLSDYCQFTDLDDRLRDRLVCGVLEENLKQKFFEEGEALTFAKALEMAQASEMAQKSVRDTRNSNGSNILRLQRTTTTSEYNGKKNSATSDNNGKKNSNMGKNKNCFRCGNKHSPDGCRFLKAKCNFCNKVGHIEKACITKKFSKCSIGPKKPKHANYLKEEKTNQQVSEEYLYHTDDILNFENSVSPITLELIIENKPYRMEIDSGAGHSIISESTYAWLGGKSKDLTKENIFLRTWSKEKLEVLGSKLMNVQYKSINTKLPLLIVAGNGPSLIGRNWFQELGITINSNNDVNFSIFSNAIENNNSVFSRFPDLFDNNFGELKGVTITIPIEENFQPIFLKSRPVPFALRDKIEQEIDRQEANGVFEKINTSSWATPIVPVLKNNGEIRICGDYAATVNKALRKVAYPLPTANEIFSKLAGCTLFSKLDLTYAYLQLKVDERSAEILTLNTPKGLYKVKRLPFGISASSSIFQQCMDNILLGIPGVSALLDDVIIGGPNVQEHDKRLEEVLQRLSSSGLKLKREKCVIKVTDIEFLGYRVDAQGIHPTDSKVNAIKKAPKPKNKKELQAFLGLYNFYERFLPKKSTILEPLHRLLDDKTRWKWTNAHDQAFDAAKNLLKSDALLVHYDQSKPLILVCDASPYGVGSVICHKMDNDSEMPIAYGSRTLRAPERNYAQIDREALSIIFGIQKFHQFLAGRNFVIYTDHKPLLGLLKPNAPMPNIISPRMLRWKLLLQAYNYEIKYRPANQMGNADALSRLPIESVEPALPNPADVLLFEVEENQSLITASDIARETQKDPVLSRVKFWILHGWPEKCPDIFKPFSSRRNELSTHMNCVLWGSRVVIPNKLRSHVLSLLHANHQGIVTTKALARSYIWWPKMDESIEILISQCSTCQKTRNAPAKTVPHSWIKSSNPWSRLHLDFAGPFQGKEFLILIDAYSKWPEIKIMNSTNSSAIINVLRDIFATHGLPDILVTDNGTNLKSQEMENFLTRNGIRHILTPPYHPSSNGQIEREVETVKQKLRQLRGGDWNTRLSRILLCLRTTPHSTTGLSPAELLMNRRPKILLDKLHPAHVVDQNKMKTPAQKKVRRFDLNDKVFMRTYGPNCKEKWIPGTVTQVNGPVTYQVTDPDGNSQHRHIDQMIKHPEMQSTHDSIEPEPDKDQTSLTDVNDEPTTSIPGSMDSNPPQPPGSPRRSHRIRKPPDRLRDFILT